MSPSHPIFPASDWASYWRQSNVWASSQIYKLNAHLFFDGIQKELSLDQDKRILNIGCGPGYLEQLLSPRVHSITGIDISSPMIETAQRNCQGIKNVEFITPPSEALEYPFLKPKTFHYFFCISVAQYFNQYQDVLCLIESVRALAEPKAKLVLADLPQAMGVFHNALEFGACFIQSLQKCYTGLLFKETVDHAANYFAYQSQLRRAGQLVWSPQILSAIFSGKSIEWRPIRFPLSICPTRLSILIDL